jgi:putative serine protease PepD
VPNGPGATVSESTTTLPFCTRCGAPNVEGICTASCRETDAAPLQPRDRRSSTPRDSNKPRTPALRLATVAVAFLLLAGAVFAYLDLSSSLRDTNQRLRESNRSIAASRSDLKDVSNSLDAVSGRLDSTEAQLNAHPAAAKLAATARTSVFTIVTDEGSGSGWVASSNAGKSTLVTNFHVVSDGWVSGNRSVKVRRGDTTYDGTIIDVAEANDLALIRVSHALPTLAVSGQRPKVGDTVLALGSPLGLGGTVTSGIVSAFRTIDAVSYMQFSAPISPGNSGGPIIDDSGKVVGVAVIKFMGEGTEGLGLAIPADRMCDALEIC